MTRTDTLATAIGADTSIARKLGLVLGASVLIAISAQIAVPMWPVPMTLQTLAILSVGLTLGSRMGAAAVLAYLAQGALGLPVFSNGAAGAAYMMGPTGGFLFGFVLLAAIAGFLAERFAGKSVALLAGSALIASAILYIPGLLWLTQVTPLDLGGAAQVGMVPFLAGDAVKSVLAALIVAGGWAALQRKRQG